MKQRMKAEKMLLGILLSVVMILGLVPGMSLTALAADPNVAISPTNGGSVRWYEAQVDGTDYYVFTATPEQGYTFVKWTFTSTSSLENPLRLRKNLYDGGVYTDFTAVFVQDAQTPSGGENSSSDNSSSDNSSSDNSSKSNKTESHTHSYSWEDVRPATEDENGEMVYRCSCGEVLYRVPTSAYNVFNRNTAEKIKNAKQGATVKIETSRWISFHKMVMQALADRPDVSLEVSFLDGEYKGNRVSFTIPAGTDTLSLLDENGFSGFLYLAGKFGTAN